LLDHHGTVLYVDDDPLNLRLVRKNLKSMGYTVLEEMDAYKGLQTAKDFQPDVIILDVNLPGMNGHEAAARLKADSDLRHIPVIALTADNRSETRAASFNSGCDAHLIKPISRGQLLKVVRQMIEQAQAHLPKDG
jgi:two-component system cell cycle response regulator DivK